MVTGLWGGLCSPAIQSHPKAEQPQVHQLQDPGAQSWGWRLRDFRELTPEQQTEKVRQSRFRNRYPSYRGEASLLGLISAVEVLLRDEQTDLTRPWEPWERHQKGEAEITTAAWHRESPGQLPDHMCIVWQSVQFTGRQQLYPLANTSCTPAVQFVESGEQQWHHQAERARPGRSQLQGPTGTPGEVLSWASVREAEISKVS